RIILLAGETEASFLAAELKSHDPSLQVDSANDRETLNALIPSLETHTRLISFCSSVIVPAEVLARFGSGTYNFHPGPPEYPGRYPSVFAIYNGAERFGVTVHEMTAAVDAGPIITADWFNLAENCELEQVEEQAYSSLIRIYTRLAPLLVRLDRRLTRMPYRWSGRKTKKSDVEALCCITPGMSADEMERRRRACGAFLKDGA
ncbi:MAG: hypothetical protein KDE14_14525, partial [Rhodobacteraceae bacterium]|nr:hypothetical protein [Paracoccaceae bacterium]